MRVPLSLDRFLTFIDAIVAIAVTLLILPLVDLTSDVTSKTPFDEVALSDEALGRYASFAVSFLVIFRLWRIHHKLMEPIELYDRVVLVTTIAWSLTIVLLPYPTALVAIYGKEPKPMGFYLVTLFLSSGCLSVLAVYLARKLELHKPDIQTPEDLAVPSVVTTVLLGVATIIALAVPRVNYGSLLLLVLTGVLSQLVYRWRAGRRTPAA